MLIDLYACIFCSIKKTMIDIKSSLSEEPQKILRRFQAHRYLPYRACVYSSRLVAIGVMDAGCTERSCVDRQAEKIKLYIYIYTYIYICVGETASACRCDSDPYATRLGHAFAWAAFSRKRSVRRDFCNGDHPLIMFPATATTIINNNK